MANTVRQLVYNDDDQAFLKSRGSKNLLWLDDLGAIPVHEFDGATDAFLFSYARRIEDYSKLINRIESDALFDSAEARFPLTRLSRTLEQIDAANIKLPTPRTWQIELDSPLPVDLEFPLFLRTDESSWKLGGNASRVNCEREFQDEAELLRRAMGWDAAIIAREWIEFASAGESRRGPVPQEVRVWCVDKKPVAWSFHHIQLIPDPIGFPISDHEAQSLAVFSEEIANLFESIFIVCDFAKTVDGKWLFLESGPGGAAGTEHEQIFKTAASAISGKPYEFNGDKTGGVYI